ncbi:MAG: hypothetical protein HFE94_07720 [Acutalibacter sp.]|nr:hypothetical protein [Acutalibacter sp.]
MYEALVHQHIPFDPIHDGFLDKIDLSKYQFLLLPGVSCLSDAQNDAVDRFVSGGGQLVLTGTPPLRDQAGRWTGPRLKCLPFEAQPENVHQAAGGYLMLSHPELYPSLPGTGLIGIGFGFTQLEPKSIPGLVRDMPRREPPKNNKPEFSNIAELTEAYGMFLYPYEKGRVLVLPWALGQMYRRYGIYECPQTPGTMPLTLPEL